MKVTKSYKFDPSKDLIGKGGFGSVYKAVDENLGIEVAIKKYTGNLPSKYSLFEEVKRVIKLTHPNLVRYYDAFQLEEESTFGDKIQVGIMEYVNGGDFLGLLKKKPDHKTLSQVFRGIMEGLKYLHENGVIHRDLKPENILLQKENGTYVPKIADFGISKVMESANDGASSMIIGSIEYMAPEQFNIAKYGKNKKLHTNLDLWSLGTLIYEAFTGEAPFGKTKMGFSREEIMQNIFSKDLDKLDQVPAPFQQIVAKCLVRDAQQRAYSVDELLQLFYQPNLDSDLGSTSILSSDFGSQNTTVFGHSSNLNTSVIGTSNNQGALHTEKISPPKQKQNQQTAKEKKADGFRAKVGKIEEDQGFKITYLIPFLTAGLIYAFYNSKYSIFGFDQSLANIAFFISIGSAALMIINLLSIFLRKHKHSFEYISYTISFVVLIYFLLRSLLEHQFGQMEGIQFDFNQHFVGKYYFIFGIVATLAATAMAVISRQKQSENP